VFRGCACYWTSHVPLVGASVKKYLKRNRNDIIVVTIFAIFAAASLYLKFNFGLAAVENFKSSFLEMISFIPLMFILIGLFEVWVPKEIIEKHIGGESGIKGILWVILFAMLQVGPLYGAFPVAYIIWKKGASIRNIFIYLGAFSTLKIPMLSFEVGFLGLKFSLLRTILSLPVFILIAVIMEKSLKGKEFKINKDVS
jgi:uncharacterized membrane protein YraQ (UPF0718 family)